MLATSAHSIDAKSAAAPAIVGTVTTRFQLLALLPLLALSSCNQGAPVRLPAAASARPTHSDAGAAHSDAGGALGTNQPQADAAVPMGASAAPAVAPLEGSCAAPSLLAAVAIDGREESDLHRCAFAKAAQPSGRRCGSGAADLDRINQAVLELDAATLAATRATYLRGKALGRRRLSLGLVGDSITASLKFLGPFAGGSASARVSLDAAVAAQLSLPEGNVIDLYAGTKLFAGLNSFSAPRAAKIGAHSSWALPQGQAASASPVGKMVRGLSPAIAVVMYGSNDATVRFSSLAELEQRFLRRMTRLLDYLADSGVVAILNTVPRHTLDPARPDCSKAAGALSDWRLSVQTSALSAVAAQLACERHLPLIDLRYALDAAVDHGIGPDGVHPTAFAAGAGTLTAAALRCGYNVRNYVTLKMLAKLLAVLD